MATSKTLWIGACTALVLAGITSPTVHAQAKRETVEWCRAVTKVHASDIERKLPPTNFSVRTPGYSRQDWEASIITYMQQTWERHPRITREELATAGMSYCVERRPAGY